MIFEVSFINYSLSTFKYSNISQLEVMVPWEIYNLMKKKENKFPLAIKIILRSSGKLLYREKIYNFLEMVK